MKSIEDKIKDGHYSSGSKAAASIKLSSLPKLEKKRLLEMLPEHYPQMEPVSRNHHPKLDPLDTPVHFAGNGHPEHVLNHELTALALRAMSLAVKHKLSREQVFDLLKERTIVEG